MIEKIAPQAAKGKSEFMLNDSEKHKWDSLGIEKAIFIACGSLSPIKEYPYEYLKEVVERLSVNYPIVILGTQANRKLYKDILTLEGVIDLVGKTEMSDVYYLLKNYAYMVLGVDSSITHLASYIGIPVVAIFGPTNYRRSCPWSKDSVILLKEELECLPCEKGKCSLGHECMKIEPEKVITAIEGIMQKRAEDERA
jgi:heptosyltransferase-2